MLVDTHCHLNFQVFKDDVDEVIRRSLDGNVWMINVGSQLATSQKAVELAEKYQEGVYAAIGLHPIHVTGEMMKNKLDPEELSAQAAMGEFNIDDYRKLALGPGGRRIKAIGEIGLDYYYKPKTTGKRQEFKEAQEEALLKQMGLAEELGLPIIFHCRSAHDDLIKLLKNHLPGVIHCFTGTWPQAQAYLAMGLYLGFNGIIFKQILGIDWPEIIVKTPMEKILVETDSPYLTPSSEAGKRNEPLFVKEVVKEIARIKKLSYEEVSEITTQNARNLFNI